MTADPQRDDLVRPTDAEVLRHTERWFLRRGIPHFIHDYRASEDVFTRTLPFLLLVGVVELVGAFDAGWVWWGNVAAVAGALAIAAGAWALLNRLRGRSTWQQPDTVGVPELGFFVVVPPLARWAVGSTATSVGVAFAFNLVVVLVVYVVTSYGVLPMVRWALGRTRQQLGAVAGLFGRAMPLLLLFSIALFINTEVWQVAASLDGALFWTAGAFFVFVGTVFLLLRLPGEVARLGEVEDATSVSECCVGSPMEGVVGGRLAGNLGAAPALTRRQRGNVLLVLLFSQGVQVVLVTVSLTMFFFVFGLVAIRPEVIGTWLGDTVDPGHLAEWRWFGHEIIVTRALVHVAGFLGILSGFYFTVYVITDGTYREEFFEEIIDQVRRSLAVRRAYLALIARPADG